MGIFLIGSTLKLGGKLTLKDSPFLKVAMKEALYFRNNGIRIDMSQLDYADASVLEILSAGCFLLRLVGNGATITNIPDWMPREFKNTVPFWNVNAESSPPEKPNNRPEPMRRMGGRRH